MAVARLLRGAIGLLQRTFDACRALFGAGATPQHEMRVHIIGGSVGEGIVVEMPQGHYAVIDFFPARPKSDGISTLSRLPKDATLDLVLLTHPHHDHYEGMAELVERYGDRIGQFRSYPPIAPQDYAVYLKRKAGRTGKVAHEHAKRYQDFVDLHLAIAQTGMEPKHVDSEHPPFEVVFDTPKIPPVRFDWLSPHDPSVKRAIEGTVANKQDLTDKVILNLRGSGEVENLLSVGVLLQYGKTRILLGSDVHNSEWTFVLEDGRLDAGAHAVKVPHHGSCKSNSQALWSAVAAKGTAVAAVTPFTSKGLPAPEALRIIRPHVSEIGCCNAAATQGMPRALKLDTKARAYTMWRAPRAVIYPSRVGCCVLHCDPFGNVQVAYEGDAGPI